MEISQISLGDRLRIRSTEATENPRHCGADGYRKRANHIVGDVCRGSWHIYKGHRNCSHIEVQTKQLWFAEEVLDFVDHGAGTIVETRGRKLVRDEHGSCREVKPNWQLLQNLDL